MNAAAPSLTGHISLRFAVEQRIPGDRCQHCGQWLYNFMAECHNCGHRMHC